MPVAWLEGFEYIPITNKWPPKRAQHGRDHDLPVRKILLHTTEGPSVQAAVNAYRSRAGRWSGGVHPHVTVNPATGERAQHCPLSRASYALKGGDTDGVIQVEIVGYARLSHLWGPDVNAWIGREVIAPIRAACPEVPLDAPLRFLGADSGLLAKPYPFGKARVSRTDWLDTYGIVGHQHPPADDHWDPGKIDIAAIIEAARPAPSVPDEEGLPAMYDVQRDPETGTTWATWTVNGTTHVRWFGQDRPDATAKPGGAWVIHEQSSIVKTNPSAGPYA